jgi:hypothetical protein
MIINIDEIDIKNASVVENLKRLFVRNPTSIPYDADFSSLTEDDEVESFTCHLLPWDIKATEASQDINMIRQGPETLAWHEDKNWPDFSALGTEVRKLGLAVRSSGAIWLDPCTEVHIVPENRNVLIDKINPDLSWTEHSPAWEYNFWEARPTGRITDRDDYARKQNGEYHLKGAKTHNGDFFWRTLEQDKEYCSEVENRIENTPALEAKRAKRRGSNFRCLTSGKRLLATNLLQKWIDNNEARIVEEIETIEKRQKEPVPQETIQDKGKVIAEAKIMAEALDRILNKPC